MKMDFRKVFVIISSLCFGQVFGNDMIQITVTATEKAMAVGYQVEGKKLGGLGKSYSGQGPINKKYLFGYRKSAMGRDITCGSLILDKDSEVKLITKGEQCQIVVSRKY